MTPASVTGEHPVPAAALPTGIRVRVTQANEWPVGRRAPRLTSSATATSASPTNTMNDQLAIDLSLIHI